VKRWIVAFGAAILGCILILLHRASGASLLQDTDTKALIEIIRARNAPLSWFGGDWPLHNHFYRPVSTLFFELDNRLYGNAAWGYGLTNALLCVACTLLLFWFLREFTDSAALAGTGTLLFALWETSLDYPLVQLGELLTLVILVGGVLRHRLRIRMWVPAALVAWELTGQIAFDHGIDSRTLAWLPGRTALVMSVFALAALAAYARYERLTAERTTAAPAATDSPRDLAPIQAKPGRFPFGWILLAVACTLLSMASYEQGIMVPGLLLAVACTFRWRGFRVRWGWQGAFWACLAAYLVVRHRLVPSAPSHYQLQQFRTGPGVWLSLLSYTFGSLIGVFTAFKSWIPDLPMTLITSEPYEMLLALACDVATMVRVRPRWILTFAGFGMSFIAFLPMAWVKEFGHYHYLPLAMRSLFVVMLGWVAWEGAVSAISPRSRQAPPRLSPAPGSLPRP
jgi:hypothetical protein